MKLAKRMKGFTLIELLIVIALIAVLAGAIMIALNPARQFAQARNSERWSHLNAIMNLISQNTVENRGVFTCASGGGIPTTTVSTISSAAYDICDCLVPTYTNALPYDPTYGHYTDCTDYDTNYTVTQSSSTSRITLDAPGAELSASITITQ